MPQFTDLSAEELTSIKESAAARLEAFRAKGVKLDMSRGKPGADQHDLSSELFTNVTMESGVATEGGVDCRNYGLPFGIPEARRLFGELLGVPAENVIVGGNSSLNMMFDTVSQGMLNGFGGSPWAAQGKVKFLCPAPGYDRHFGVCEYFGIEMIAVPMTGEGPDLDEVRRLAENDPMVKGMWCVPKYSNPQGITYSDDTVRALAALKPAAQDFRIFWDNAYAVHDLYEDRKDTLLNFYEECKKQGREDMVFTFTSTSKITFSSGGLAAMAASERNCELLKKRISMQTIGPDKLNQLRHTRFLPDMAHVEEQMKRHAAIIAPKFQAVLQILSERLGGRGIGEWTDPNGGYFISFESRKGCAGRIVSVCREAGVTLTSAGATYPYGKDPEDSNIRISPTFPPVDELREAIRVFCDAVEFVSAEKLLSETGK